MSLVRSSSSPGILQIPPPPCQAFQPSRRTRMVKKSCDDPFLAAMKACTKNSTLQIVQGRKKTGLLSFFKRGRITFSCKHVTQVREDGLVRLS
ncbi:hypothetical protein SOVF_168960 [Spinacia oleracea]|nr:hypothetical protein SOVF_168960 [Spinacia oleracea]